MNDILSSLLTSVQDMHRLSMFPGDRVRNLAKEENRKSLLLPLGKLVATTPVIQSRGKICSNAFDGIYLAQDVARSISSTVRDWHCHNCPHVPGTNEIHVFGAEHLRNA